MMIQRLPDDAGEVELPRFLLYGVEYLSDGSGSGGKPTEEVVAHVCQRLYRLTACTVDDATLAEAAAAIRSGWFCARGHTPFTRRAYFVSVFSGDVRAGFVKYVIVVERGCIWDDAVTLAAVCYSWLHKLVPDPRRPATWREIDRELAANFTMALGKRNA